MGRAIKSLGKGWVVLQGESVHFGEERLISVLSPKKSSSFIAKYVEQTYVDRFASFDEKISYKKNRKKSPYLIEQYQIRPTTIDCGHDPIFSAFLAHTLIYEDDYLVFSCHIYTGSHPDIVVTDYSHKIKLS